MGDNSQLLHEIPANLISPVKTSDVADKVLSFGLSFPDLYNSAALFKLDAAFLEFVGVADSSLRELVTAARRDATSLSVKSQSELLLALTPHVDAFIGKLFGIEREIAILAGAHHELAPLYSVKRL